MKHIGGPARSGDELEAERQQTQRRMQLALMPKRELLRLHARLNKKAGQPVLIGPGPGWTREEIAAAVVELEKNYNI